jgi:hypothetical protein
VAQNHAQAVTHNMFKRLDTHNAVRRLAVRGHSFS